MKKSSSSDKRPYRVLTFSLWFLLSGCQTFSPVKPDFSSLESDVTNVGDLLWIDLLSKDVVEAKAFYQAVFSWQYVTNESGYITIMDNKKAIGGMLLETHIDAGSRWMPMFSVFDIENSAATALQMKGKVPTQPTKIFKNYHYAVISDTEGASFGVMSGVNGIQNNAYAQSDSIRAQLWSHDLQTAYQFYRPLFALKIKPTNPAPERIMSETAMAQNSDDSIKKIAVPVEKKISEKATQSLSMRRIFSADERPVGERKKLVFGIPDTAQKVDSVQVVQVQTLAAQALADQDSHTQTRSVTEYDKQTQVLRRIQYGVELSMNAIEIPWDNIPAQWVISFSVINSQDILSKIIQAGGNVIIDFNNPLSDGSVAIAEDPTGAIFILRLSEQ
jgi:predicted enzyme related to lactoylglutathione lyase